MVGRRRSSPSQSTSWRSAPRSIPGSRKPPDRKSGRESKAQIDHRLRLPVAPAADGAVALSWQHGSVEDLAQTLDLHPKVIRKGIRLAFLAPTITLQTFYWAVRNTA